MAVDVAVGLDGDDVGVAQSGERTKFTSEPSEPGLEPTCLEDLERDGVSARIPSEQYIGHPALTHGTLVSVWTDVIPWLLGHTAHLKMVWIRLFHTRSCPLLWPW